MQNRILRSILLGAILVAPFCVNDARAQYFGQNKVEYQDFDFNILHTPHFDIYYYPEERPGIDYAALMAERWYTRIETIFRDTLHDVQPLILYASFPQFEQTNVVQGIGVGTGGVTESVKRRIVLPFAGPLDETDHVIGHELVHAFQYDITGIGHGGPAGVPSAEKLPLWFIEGMAEYLSLGPVDPNTSMWMREAVKKKDIPDIADLNNPKYFPYRYGQALLSYIGGRWGDRKIGDLLRAAGTHGNMETAFDSVLSISADSLSKDWHAALHAQYDSLISVTDSSVVYGPTLISEKTHGGALNVSPVLSPDGKEVVFFSSKGLFSIDLYLADAVTGEVKKDIYSTALDTHLENLEFISSAGSWDPAGNRYVFSAVNDGRPVLEILNIRTGNMEREINFPTLGQIFDPACSPDGGQIVFSAIANGLSDLYSYDLQTDETRRLTDDAYAELHPAWSPDGKYIAFSTDRFTTKLRNIDIGNYRLALLNFDTGAIRELPGFSNGKNINPQWSPDGKSIFFLSDQNGITNIYKLDLASKKTEQVTNLYGGVSGIAAISPALSVSLRENKIAYSVFDNGNYNICLIDSGKVLSGKQVADHYKQNPAVLPPAERASKLLVANLHNPDFGLPADTSYNISDYSASLSLDGIGQPSLAAGVNPFGTYFGGGVALFWSDMLGNHNLATALSIQSGSGNTDISALVGYFNQKHRWQWGGVVQQIPYVYGGVRSGYGTVSGEDAYIEQLYLYKEIDRETSGAAYYPFSRAMRVEFSAGYKNISFSNTVNTRAVSLNSGSPLLDRTEDLPSGSALNLGTAGAALVFDNSFFGAASPILGQRYRLEVSPTFGSLTWTDVLADYRHYLLPIRPFTIALRVLHYGRYGRSADDSRLSPLYLGYPGLVRGYNNGFLSANQYAFDVANGSFQMDNLYGSKILVGNAEIRFPLFGVFGLGEGYYGFFPIELATFFDSGVSWTGDTKPWFFGGHRGQVNSVGEALRLNLFGIAVFEVDYVKPLDLPDKGWVWEFNIIQGF